MQKNSILNLWEVFEYSVKCNYGRVLNIPKFEQARFLRMQARHKVLKYAWISLSKALWQDSEYAWSEFHTVLTKPPFLNKARLRIWLSICSWKRLWICEECLGYWTYLNKPEYALIITQYAWICLNNAEYDTWNKMEQKEYYLIAGGQAWWRGEGHNRAFLSKIWTLFDFQKEQGRLPS